LYICDNMWKKLENVVNVCERTTEYYL